MGTASAVGSGQQGRVSWLGLPAAVACHRCFGFDTAVEESQRALLAAKVEASSARHGLGLVKLMGRQSGFIAMQASMASGACRSAPLG